MATDLIPARYRPLGAVHPRYSYLLTTIMFLYLIEKVVAQAPVNDVISWPSGLLLLASVLYAALGNGPENLWEIEPTAGLFLFAGLPLISIPRMQKVNWVSTTCHFVSRIRSAYGKSNFWIRAESVTERARTEALQKVTRLLSCVIWEDRPIQESELDSTLWDMTPAGLLQPVKPASASPPSAVKPGPATAKDFLLFAAIDYHVFREWEVEIRSGDKSVFSTKGIQPSAVVDVDSEEAALYVVAANMTRRPHSQSPIRSKATQLGEETFVLDLDSVDLDAPACWIDFHSYAPESAKVSASLLQLAHSYFVVVHHINQQYAESQMEPAKKLARIHVGQTLWIAILGGALLDTGRLTIQHLPGRWGMKNISPDQAYLSRIGAVLELIEPIANSPNDFGDTVFSGGLSRRTAIPFLLVGLFGQAIICYFLSVGTSAGVWTSVALANSLYAGRLTDWHSMWYGKSAHTDQPGMKMYLPGTKQLMCIATLDRSTPRQGFLRQGFLLNIVGLIAAILGAVFQESTRRALEFGEFRPSPPWVSYTAVALCIGTSSLILITVVIQQIHEKTWSDDSELPTRWMVYSTIIPSFVVAGLAVFFQLQDLARFWPILDALTWISGLPLGMLENGRIFAADDNLMHLVLLNRWIMGAVASSLGSSQKG